MIFTASFSSNSKRKEPELVECEDVSGCAATEKGRTVATFLMYNGRYFINSKTGNIVTPEEFDKLDLVYVPARDDPKIMEISMLEFIPDTVEVDTVSGSGG